MSKAIQVEALSWSPRGAAQHRFQRETGSVYGVIDIWHLAPAGLLEQISLIVGYTWLIMIARYYRSTFATSPDRRRTDEGIDHDTGDAR